MKTKKKVVPPPSRGLLIDNSICIAFESLKSHLYYARKGPSKDFHRRSIRQYAQLILNLSKLY